MTDKKHRDFGIFRSNVSHSLVHKGDIQFMIDVLESDDIRKYWNECLTFESLYLLATLDYLSRKNDIEICTNYNDIRRHRFEKYIFPTGILLKDSLFPEQNLKQKAIEECIPEFLAHGIIEKELYDAV